MRIFRLIYFILSLIAIAVVFSLSIVYEKTNYSFLLVFIVLIPNYYFRQSDRKKTASIILSYSFDCDPEFYLNNLNKYRRHCVLSKTQKNIFDLYNCIGHLDAGNFDQALDLLINIDKSGVVFDDVTNILFMKNWCEYFYYNNQDVKMKTSLLRLKDYITKSNNPSVKQGSSLLYHGLEAKYYILVGENLEKAKKLYNDAISMAPSKLNVTKALYELALIDIKNKDYQGAVEKLKRVTEGNNNLYVVKRSKELLNMYNNR